MLKGENISYKIENRLILDNISLEVKEKEKIAITGVSGSGKTTLLYILSTFLKPTGGKVFLFGKNIYSLKYKEILKIRREKISFIFQFHYLFKGFSALDNIKLAAILANKKLQLDKNLLPFDLDKDASKLSGGEQQRVAIKRALVKKPRIIFADEPTGNLDEANSKIVMDILEDYIEKNRASLILVTHNLELAKRCDRVYRLKSAKLF